MNDQQQAQFLEAAHESLKPLAMAQEALAAVQEQGETTEQPLLIGIGGKYRAGKDTLADHMVSHYGFQKLNMSDPLAWSLYTLNPWIVIRENEYGRELRRYRDMADDIGYTEAKKNLEVRRLLQVLGTEVGRELDEDLWVKVAARNIADIRATGTPVVITGIRYPNELDMIRSAGGALVWVERPQVNLLDIGGDQSTTQVKVSAIPDALDAGLVQFHTSEVTLGAHDFDITVDNDGTEKELQAKAAGLIETLKDIHAGTTPDLDAPYFSQETLDAL